MNEWMNWYVSGWINEWTHAEMMNIHPAGDLKYLQERQAGCLPKCLLERQSLSWWFCSGAKSGLQLCRLSLKPVCQHISRATSLRQLLINPAQRDRNANILIYNKNYKCHEDHNISRSSAFSPCRQIYMGRQILLKSLPDKHNEKC